MSDQTLDDVLKTDIPSEPPALHSRLPMFSFPQMTIGLDHDVSAFPISGQQHAADGRKNPLDGKIPSDREIPPDCERLK
uniref:Uncharacterized protein n=1 Tax=Peronospora matthiolae TaxID=2874970 RepID=A0AAV1U929_9STRA